MASPEPQQDNSGKRRPVRAVLAALGVGLVWAAAHMPVSIAEKAALITWLLHALVATLLAKAFLDLAGAIVVWNVKSAGELFARLKR